MRMELGALLEGGPSASAMLHSRHGNTPIPSLLLTGTAGTLGNVQHGRTVSSTGVAPNRSSSSSSGQVRTVTTDTSNLSFTSLLAGYDPALGLPPAPQPPARDSSGSNDLLSSGSNNNSFASRRRPNPMPQVNSSDSGGPSNGSFTGGRQGSSMLMPQSPMPSPATPMPGINGSFTASGMRQHSHSSSSLSSDLQPPPLPPPSSRRPTQEGKKHA